MNFSKSNIKNLFSSEIHEEEKQEPAIVHLPYLHYETQDIQNSLIDKMNNLGALNYFSMAKGTSLAQERVDSLAQIMKHLQSFYVKPLQKKKEPGQLQNIFDIFREMMRQQQRNNAQDQQENEQNLTNDEEQNTEDNETQQEPDDQYESDEYEEDQDEQMQEEDMDEEEEQDQNQQQQNQQDEDKKQNDIEKRK